MAQVDLNGRFPNMTPIKSAPSLFRFNGCGVGLYGHRDADAETGAYVATLCISLLFVPLIALRAYRVARARQGGWYFLGREPLSSFAKRCNLVFLAAVITTAGTISVSAYTSTPGYKARVRMAEARRLVTEGHAGQAAKVYESLAVAGAEEAENAAQAIKDLVSEQGTQPLDPDTVAVFASAVQVTRRTHAMAPADVTDQAIKLVTDKGTTDPRSAIGVLDVVRPLSVDTRPIDNQRLAMLQKWAAAEPSNLDAVVPLASLLEQQNKLDEAKKLLLPVKGRLGDGDGARVLGIILARDHDYDGSYALLWPYVKVRLDKLHSAEKAAEATNKQLAEREIKLLEEDKGPADFYKRYEAASKEGKHAIVREYLDQRMKADPQFIASQDALEREVSVVPVAMDLGIIMLQRAQAQTDSDARKTQLEAAEKVFLSISGIVGQTDEYRMSLGQIYYWLGKQAEGRKLFDDLLAAKSRSYESVMGIASKMRELGSDPDARTLSEEAYNKASKSEEKYAAASFRAVCAKDSDDEVAWLNRADTSDPAVRARIASTTGDKAYREGRDADAIIQYRGAIDAYSAMPRSCMTLNEMALAYHAVFRSSGDRKALEQCVDSFQQAVDLKPSDSILLFNAGIVLLDASLSDIMATDIDLHALHEMGNAHMLGFLYRDQAGREITAQRVKEHPGIRKALSYLEKTMVVAPKNANAYDAASDIYSFTRNESALRELERRIRAAGLDPSDQTARLKEFLSGARDQTNLTRINASLKRSEELCNALRPKGGVTAAVALDAQVSHLVELDLLTGNTDAQKVLDLAQEAAKVSPSAATTSTLVGAHLFRASKDLCQKDPAFFAWNKKYCRSLGASYLIVIAASEPGPFQQEVLAQTDVKKAMEIGRDSMKLFPADGSTFYWALQKNADAAEAQRLAEIIRKTPFEVLSQTVQSLLAPARPGEAVPMYWMQQVVNDPVRAREALAPVTAAGIPLPIRQ